MLINPKKSGKYLFIILFIIISYSAFSQLGDIRLAAGISTIQILGNNIGTKPFVYETGGNTIYGGSYDQAQPGIRLEATMPINQAETFEIPFGLEYNFFMGRERTPFGARSDIKMRHDNDVLTFSLGLNYSFYKFNPLDAEAKFYAGLDTRTTFILQGTYSQIGTSEIPDPSLSFSFKTKPTTIRFGGNLNVGINGKLMDPLYVDIKAGLGIMNLVGRNDYMGELFTLGRKNITYVETKESMVYTFNVAMMLQIKL
jgi:hypothetical protein